MFSHFESEKLLADQYHISRLEFDLAFYSDECSVAASFVCQHESIASLNDPRVFARHESVVWKNDVAG